MTNRSVLITGCSSGIGYLSALHFARNGWNVFACVRDTSCEGVGTLKKLARKEKLRLQVLKMDVTKASEIEVVFSTISTLDVLINNAGYGNIGPVEDFTIEEIQDLYDVNVFGAIRVAQSAIPLMRNQGYGRIINISSINGLLSFGLYGVYSSSKFALESLSEALRFELAPFNIDVVLVEPGAFETKFAENSKRPQKYLSKETPYKNLADPLKRTTTRKFRDIDFVKDLTNPQRVVDVIYRSATVKTPQMRYLIGIDAYLYTFARRFLPYNLWLKMLRLAYKW
jgi:NAD(P)-dependent dehydrogenase (short-subunit alcohol dehydrogenase family)